MEGRCIYLLVMWPIGYIDRATWLIWTTSFWTFVRSRCEDFCVKEFWNFETFGKFGRSDFERSIYFTLYLYVWNFRNSMGHLLCDRVFFAFFFSFISLFRDIPLKNILETAKYFGYFMNRIFEIFNSFLLCYLINIRLLLENK